MSNRQLVCVKRPEPGLSAVFEDMYLNERLVDVTLSCYDGQLHAHRLVLAASSPYFSGLFDKLANPFHYPVVVIKDMQIEDLRMLVEFMYRGQLTVTQDKLLSLIKNAESLQIHGLSNNSGLVSHGNIDLNDVQNGNVRQSMRTIKSITKRAKKSAPNQHQIMLPARGGYNFGRQDLMRNRLSPQPDKLLEQSMITGESLDDSFGGLQQQFNYNPTNPTSTRNLNNQLQTPSPSAIQIQPQLTVDAQQQRQTQQQQQQQQQQQLSTQLQVLSHSLAANRSSSSSSTSALSSMNIGSGNANGIQHAISNQVSGQQPVRARVHSCSICWKTFREKANLKRHLQVHSIDRVIYACPDCNKTFSWKDNYIRHTKAAHHMNNVRQQV